MGSEHISYCRNCGANCGLILDIEDDRIVGLRNDRDNPASQGYACIKGSMAVDLHNGDETRLVQCHRKGPDGAFHAIGKEDALDEIAATLQRILAEHGPRALAMYFGTTSYLDSIGKPFAKKFMAEIGSPNIFSSMTIDQSSKWVVSGRMGAFGSGKPVLDQTDVVLLAGNNPLISHQAYPMSPIPSLNIHDHVRKAKKRGVKFIVIDPRRTETARIADLFIQPYPGHDVEIFGALIRLLLENDGQNKSFCDRYVANIAALRQAVAPFTPERVARSAGIEAQDLHLAATWLAAAEKPCVASGTGPSMSADANTAEHLIEVLNALVGGYVRAGEAIPNQGIFAPRADVEMVAPPNRSWEKEPKCHSADFGLLMGEFPVSLLPDEILTPGPAKIRAMIVIGGNPAMCLGDPEKTFEAFRDLDLLVTIDPRMSATAQLSHYVIAPPLQFERAEATTHTDYSFPWTFAQYSPAAKAPPPGTLGEWEFFWGLSKRMGIQLSLEYMPFSMFETEDDGETAPPPQLMIDMNRLPPREDLIAWIADQTAVPFETLKAHPHGYMPDLPPKILQAPTHDDGVRLNLCPADVAAEIAAVAARAAPPQADYLLTVRRTTESYNSMFHGNAITQRRMRTNWLYIHPGDLAAIGVGDGDGVEMRSDDGDVVAYVKGDATLKRGVVAMTNGWGAGPDGGDPLGLKGAHTGRLVSMTENLQTINRMPLLSGIPVTVTPLAQATAAQRAAEPVH